MIELLPLAIGGAVVNRIRGGLGGKILDKVFFGHGNRASKATFSISTGALAAGSFDDFGNHPIRAALLAAVCSGTTFLGQSIGHGSYMGLGRTGDQINAKPESIDAILDIFYSSPLRRNLYGYQFLGLEITGVALCLALSLPFLYWEVPWCVFFFFLLGLTKGPAYEIAWRVPSAIDQIRQGPELGEALFGAFLWVGIWMMGAWCNG